MTNILIGIIIFLFVLMIYLHIRFHLKVNNDLDVFTISDNTQERINKVCNLKQPFKFNYINKNLLGLLTFENLKKNHGHHSLNIRKINETLYLPMKLENSIKLFEQDVSNNYFSENNLDFLNESNLLKFYKNDSVLTPNLVSNKKYDMICGKQNTSTITKYNLYYRNFFYVTDGQCKIKLFSPDNIDKLNINKNYELFEYSSSINPFKENINNYKTTELILKKGDIIFIPPYWSYCFHFIENTIISSFHYGTYMSNLSIIPEFINHMFQRQNIVEKLK